jgi:uncharacterized 2Fe-2S/4Fe-4S cluster protein (DUF4445 family)
MSASVTLNGRALPLGASQSLFAAGTEAGIVIPSSCRQQGRCRECLVEVTAGAALLTAPSAEERDLRPGFRLSCRCRPADGSEGTIVAHTLLRPTLRIEDRALHLPASVRGFAHDPAVRREGDSVRLDGREIHHGPGPILGVAIDLGTTTVALRVIDLESAAVVAGASFENPQRFAGSDVMARIQYDTDHSGRLLQRTLLAYLTRVINGLPIAASSIYEYAIAGNSTMRDLLFGLDVRPIGQKPYRSTIEQAWRDGTRPDSSVSTRIRELRLPGHPEGRVYGLPLVGGHVGADAAACLLALEPHLSDDLVAIMDIGTNTEVFFGNRHRLLAASCPAGPAFEGGAISCGLPGVTGAIERVQIADDGKVEARVIGDAPADGICGSGLIDLLGELSRTGHMNERGRLESGDEAFVVDAARGIALRESDINELAQAKGANVAGLQIVARRAGRRLADLDRFYLAGGFGRHIDLAAARRIGLIPDLPDDRVVAVGNIAIEGAAIALLSVSRRRELEALVGTIEHVELETDPGFFDEFVAGCQFQAFGREEDAPLS